MAHIATEVVKVTTTGSDASATGSAYSGSLNGYLLDIYLDFHASAPATTDTTISYAEKGGNICVVTDSATDALIAPRDGAVDVAAAAITDSHVRYPLNGRIKIALAGSNALTNALVAYIRYESLG